MAAYFGIDLGTTQCLAAQFQRNPFTDEEEVTCLTNPETGENELPSVVSFLSDEKYVTGEAAMSRLYKEPDSTVELVKVRLGQTDTITVNIPGKGETDKSPQEIASLLLKSLKETRGNKIDSAMLTVPAFFNQSQREATKQAGTMAGIDTENQIMIEEPTAAIVYQIYAEYQKGKETFLENLKTGENVLVFDFGGGTLDLSAIRITCDEDAVQSEVLAHEGDPNLGGNIIDFLMTEYILNRLKAHYPKEEEVQAAADAFQPYLSQYLNDHVLRFGKDVPDHIKQLIFITKRTAEDRKKDLTSKDVVTIRTPFTRCEPFRFTRDDFEELILNNDTLNLRERIDDTLGRMAVILAEKDVQIDRVLLVGGSSQIPYIREIIKETFEEFHLEDDRITISDDCMQAVVLGAAIQQALRKGESILPFRTNCCRNIVAREIYLGCGQEPVKLYVESGQTYPFAEDRDESILIPHALSENVSFALYEKVQDRAGTRYTLISTYDYFLPLYYTGDEIKVHLNIGEDGLYQVSATYTPTNETVFFETNKEHMLTDEKLRETEKKVAKMILA